MAKGDDIEERLINFAVGVVKLSDSVATTLAGKHVGHQLLRSGTAPAAHYGEARGAESKRDFLHKLRIALKELNESRNWLKIMTRSGLAPSEKLQPLNQEVEELCRIINASVRTTKNNLRSS